MAYTIKAAMANFKTSSKAGIKSIVVFFLIKTNAKVAAYNDFPEIFLVHTTKKALLVFQKLYLCT
jgi:hypothetical protein